MIDEGYVKFHAEWRHGPSPAGIGDLVAARNRLRRLGLVGIYPDSGIGYGNISSRLDHEGRFVVSGSATGGILEATSAHFCLVTGWDLDRNTVHCTGPVPASSESMTHAMLYQCAPWIGAVVHVHDMAAWESLLGNIPTSDPSVAYGTPGMALEMQRLLSETNLAEEGVLAMGGHREGLIAIGHHIGEAIEKMLGKIGRGT